MKIAEKAEAVERRVFTEHGYRNTIVVAMDEIARSPQRDETEIVALVAQRLMLVTWAIDSRGHLGDDLKALQWAANTRLISDLQYQIYVDQQSENAAERAP